jgi:hypothetical protein
MPEDYIIQTKEEFLSYLRETLIPDLRESGNEGMVTDFEAAILFIEGAKEIKIEYTEGRQIVLDNGHSR